MAGEVQIALHGAGDGRAFGFGLQLDVFPSLGLTVYMIEDPEAELASAHIEMVVVPSHRMVNG